MEAWFFVLTDLTDYKMRIKLKSTRFFILLDYTNFINSFEMKLNLNVEQKN